jgi:hypothetical protein
MARGAWDGGSGGEGCDQRGFSDGDDDPPPPGDGGAERGGGGWGSGRAVSRVMQRRAGA